MVMGFIECLLEIGAETHANMPIVPELLERHLWQLCVPTLCEGDWWRSKSFERGALTSSLISNEMAQAMKAQMSRTAVSRCVISCLLPPLGWHPFVSNLAGSGSLAASE